MENVYDIRYEKGLTFILPQEADTFAGALPGEVYARTAVFLYLYYLDILPIYWSYIDGIPGKITLYVISSQNQVLEKVQKHAVLTGRTNIHYIWKPNQGRDISAFLIAGADIVKNYQYVCFLHDKKERSVGLKKDTDLWIENLWGNLVGGADYIGRVLCLFESCETLGVLAPPDPIGDHFSTWYGYGWHRSYQATKTLAVRLQLQADVSADKPPVTIGTALWFRSAALRKLFEVGWEYSDFDDSKLNTPGYLSYGVERIFAYVAQDAGYDTGTVMTVPYAQKQTNYLQYTTGKIFAEARRYFPVACMYDLARYNRNLKRLLNFAEENQNLYLYGAGEMGRFCFYLLKSANLSADGYLVSGEPNSSVVNGLALFSVRQIDRLPVRVVVITVYDEDDQDVIADNLEDRGFYNFIKFWA